MKPLFTIQLLQGFIIGTAFGIFIVGFSIRKACDIYRKPVKKSPGKNYDFIADCKLSLDETEIKISE